VVTVISPFNFPWHLSMRSVAPALGCGNAVVLKPASDTPVTGGTLIGKLFEEAGIPRGVLQVIVGAGSDIGDAIVDHPVPRVVSFTGSTPVGQHLGSICGKRIKKASLELGGNAPMVIFDDSDLMPAIDAAIFGKFSHQGQICMATNRILVQRGIYDAFVEGFVARSRELVVGEMNDPKTMIGPIINKKQFDGILNRVQRTKDAGARTALEGKPQGLVIPPIVLVGVTNDMPCAREENFGPVAPILAFDSDEDGIALANDTWAGLSSAVFSSDRGRAEWAASRIEAGMVHINDASVNDEANTAFGGVKQSGLGRFGGRWAMDEFTETKRVSVMLEPREFAGVGGP
jgi:aldehyde dehydrogenase (NAD+)